VKAIRIHQHGDLDVLSIDEIEKPLLSNNQVLVQIKAAALNQLDLFVRRGIPGISLPIIMGSDGSGIITEIGKKVDNIQIGDEVIIVPFKTCEQCDPCINGQEQICKKYQIRGEHLNGCQTDFIAIDEKYVLPKPQNITFHEAAAFPLAYMTAYQMLINKAQLKENQLILIWGASSGIGSGAIQIAKIIQAKVITTVSSEDKRQYARDLGADYVINYKTENVATEVKEITEGTGVDVVFEHPGKSTFLTSMRVLKTGGKIVTCGATTGPIVNLDLRHLFIKHQQIIGSTMGNRNDLFELIELIKKNKLKPIVSHSFHYSEIKNAHKILEEGIQLGKIVIDFT
jgi:NADPH:quinone reductase-like Zn-dependent oxidoreductase